MPESAGILSVFGADQFSLLYRKNAEWQHFRRIASLDKSMRVLELGCGAGRWSILIAPYVKEVIAIDFSEEMIRLAETAAEQSNIKNIQFHVGPAQDFVSMTQFDLIYLSGVDQYIEEGALYSVISNIRKMVATNGIVIDRVTTSTSERFFCDIDGYKCIYRSLPELECAFSEAGFELTYKEQSHQRFRLSRISRWPLFMKGMVWMMKRNPRSACLLVQVITTVLNIVRPLKPMASDRSHDFLLFRLLKS